MGLSIDLCMGELVQAILREVYGGAPEIFMENMAEDSITFCLIYHTANPFVCAFPILMFCFLL